MSRSTTPNTKRLVILLLISLWLQVITPPVMAARRGSSPLVSMMSNAPHQLLTKLALVEHSLVSLLRAALTPQDNWNVVLTPVSTEFKDYSGLDYHASSRKLLLSANTPGGLPNNFEAVAADGSRSSFSNVAALNGDLLVATSRDEAQGMSRGGFPAGELFTSTGVAGVIARVR